MFALEAEKDRRQPVAGERVLLNPETSEPMTRPRLYHRMMTLGKRAGVPEAHPHRFRDTLAADMAGEAATSVENGEGLEKTDCTIITRRPAETRRIQQKRLITKTLVAGEPVSRILSGAPFAKRTARRGDHSSRSRFAP